MAASVITNLLLISDDVEENLGPGGIQLTSLVPRLSVKKGAWYRLLAHAFNYLKFLSFVMTAMHTT